jgi:hypothetical protein
LNELIQSDLISIKINLHDEIVDVNVDDEESGLAP